jgi:hypothetical protein
MKRLLFGTAAFLAYALIPALAQTPLGPAFQVNSDSTGRQIPSGIATDADGNFLVTWSQEDTSFARRYDRHGQPIGEEIELGVPGQSVAVGHAGDFVVVWTSTRVDGAQYFLAQRFEADGSRRGDVVQVNGPGSISSGPHLVVQPSGAFIVTWASTGEIPTGARIDNDGSRTDFRVGTGFARSVPIAADGDGNFVVLWYSTPYLGDYVYARRFDAAAQPVGEQFVVNTSTASRDPSFAAVAMNPSGDFVVSWQDTAYRRNGTRKRRVFAQRFDPLGRHEGRSFRVDGSEGDSRYPSVAIDEDGSFIVSWIDGHVRLLQAFDARRRRIGAEYRVEQPEGFLSSALLGDNRLALVGSGDDGDNGGVFARLFDLVSTCGGLAVSTLGTAGADLLRGTEGDDVISGGHGHDTIRGLGGNDVICGGGGADVIRGNEGDDVILGGAGRDVLAGGPGNDRLRGGRGRDTLDGGSGDDACDPTSDDLVESCE